MSIRKIDADVPRDASGHRIKDNQIVVNAAHINKEVASSDFAKTNKVFLLEVAGDTDDTYTLTLDGVETDDIDFDAEAADVQAAFNAIFDAPDTLCTDDGAGSIFIECVGKRAGSDDTTLTVDDTGMESMDATAEVTLTTHGSTDQVLNLKGGGTAVPSAVTRV